MDRESREYTGEIQAVMESRVKQERKKEIQRKVRGRKNKELVPPKIFTRQKISWYNEGDNVDWEQAPMLTGEDVAALEFEKERKGLVHQEEG